MSDTVTIPREEYEQLKSEINALKDSRLYKRLLEFEENIKEESFSRKDLGL